jgi:hypothetical protein
LEGTTIIPLEGSITYQGDSFQCFGFLILGIKSLGEIFVTANEFFHFGDGRAKFFVSQKFLTRLQPRFKLGSVTLEE